MTGHFEVLLAASVAPSRPEGTARNRASEGHGAPGCDRQSHPRDTPGGGDSVKILFGKKTAKLLHQLHRVSLMVRLIVRNFEQRDEHDDVNSLVPRRP